MYQQYLTDFVFENTDAARCLIRLTKPPYEDVVVNLGRFTVNPESNVAFDYEVISHSPGRAEESLKEEFVELLGFILLALMEKHLEKTTSEVIG